MTARTAYIALGSNVGDRGEALVSALRMLDAADGVSVRRVSQFLITKPVGGPEDQPDYLNAAAEITTTLQPRELLERLNAIERALGRNRQREVRWGPRTCDLDILLIGEMVIDEPGLTVPHPRMHLRRFVLEPLAAIAPAARHPVLGRTVQELLVDLAVSGGGEDQGPPQQGQP